MDFIDLNNPEVDLSSKETDQVTLNLTDNRDAVNYCQDCLMGARKALLRNNGFERDAMITSMIGGQIIFRLEGEPRPVV